MTVNAPPAARLRSYARVIVEQPWFEGSIIALILLNAVVLALDTLPEIVQHYGGFLKAISGLVITVFVLEALLKIAAIAPQWKRYFGDGWNLFDFSIVVLSLLPASGSFAMVARLARLLRVMRLISALPELRLIVTTLIRSIPSMGHVLLLMSVIFYVYGIVGYYLFHEHDPEHWRHLGLALLTLFRVVTLEDWTDLMYTAMELTPWAWVYFVSFVIVGTFVVINLFIAVVLNNLNEAKAESLQRVQTEPDKQALMTELIKTQQHLQRLQQLIQQHEKQ